MHLDIRETRILNLGDTNKAFTLNTKNMDLKPCLQEAVQETILLIKYFYRKNVALKHAKRSIDPYRPTSDLVKIWLYPFHIKNQVIKGKKILTATYRRPNLTSQD